MAKKQSYSKDDIRKSVAKNLLQQRNGFEPKMTQQNVADLFNPPLSRAAIAQWEVGDTLPDIDRLVVLSKAFGCTIDSLIFGDNYVDEDLSPEVAKLARVINTLSRKNRDIIASMVYSLKSSNGQTKDNR